MRQANRFAITMLACVGATAFQAVAAEEGPVIEEEIIVTATYRDTALMDTPLSISALDSDDIDKKGILNFQNLYQSIPGLSYHNSGGLETFNVVGVRGLTGAGLGEGGPAVGIYLDGVSLTDTNTDGGISQVIGALFDIQRVEVLKGPQGTLYGEAAMGGAIRYISNPPDPTQFEATVHGEYEQMKYADDPSYRTHATINIPLVEDRLALRGTVYYRDRAGLMDIPAPRNEEDVNDQEETGFRAKLSWYVTDRFEISASAQIWETEYGGFGVYCCDNSYVNTERVQPDFPNGGTSQLDLYSAALRYKFDFADLEIISSFYKRDLVYGEESSPRSSTTQTLVGFGNAFLPAFVPELAGIPAIKGVGFYGVLQRDTERYVQEVRLISNTDGKWQWSVGGYWKDDEAGNYKYTDDMPSFYFSLDPMYLQYQQQVLSLAHAFAYPPDTNRSEELAAFGELSYRFNDQWELLVGGRITDIERTETVFPQDKVTDTFFSPKVTLTWRPEQNLMVYGTFAQGFRPGVTNPNIADVLPDLQAQAATDPSLQSRIDLLTEHLTIDGDEVLNFEVGAKSTFWDGRARLRLALYHLDWNDTLVFQALNELGGILGLIGRWYNDNLDDGVVSQGIEMELDLAITEDLSLHIGYDNNWKAKSKGDSVSQTVGPDGRNVLAPAGSRLPNSPKYSFNISADHDFRFGEWAANARLDWYRVPRSYASIDNTNATRGYHQLDGRVTLYAPGDQLSLAVYGANLDNERVAYSCSAFGCYYGRPRTVGLSATYSLGGK